MFRAYFKLKKSKDFCSDNVITLFYTQPKTTAMSLGSQFQQRKMEFAMILGFAALAVSTTVSLALIYEEPMGPPAGPLSVSVFATNNQVSSRSTIYVYTFKTATSSLINGIEITAPSLYDIKGVEYIGGSDNLAFSSFEVSGQKMKVVLDQPVTHPAGKTGMIEIGGINNPSMPGQYTFTITTIDSKGSVVDSGAASFKLEEPIILQNSVNTEHIQDSAITSDKVSDRSISLDKLASDVISLFQNQFSTLEEQLTRQINALRMQLESEESSRVAEDIDESSARAAGDEDIREEIEELRGQIEMLQEEVEAIANNS